MTERILELVIAFGAGYMVAFVAYRFDIRRDRKRESDHSLLYWWENHYGLTIRLGNGTTWCCTEETGNWHDLSRGHGAPPEVSSALNVYGETIRRALDGVTCASQRDREHRALVLAKQKM